MTITHILTWWYASGWRILIHKTRVGLSNIVDFFSMGSLLRTLFKPFRQISAASASAGSSLDLKFHMFTDRLVSRIIGFFTRLLLLIVGLVLIALDLILSFILIIIWPFIPLTPIAGIILTISGVII